MWKNALLLLGFTSAVVADSSVSILIVTTSVFVTPAPTTVYTTISTFTTLIS
jgi:hypothetical protein